MTKSRTYTFRIENFTPESMPFGRLVEYYREVKRMLGGADNLHLVEVAQGSHASAFRLDQDCEFDFEEHISALNAGTAPHAAMRARETIDAMLREDATSGSFCDPTGENVVPFPGKFSAVSNQLRVRGAANFVGELYHIAGTGDNAKVRINTGAYGVVFCVTSKDIAKSLREFLFEKVKVSGRGMWTKASSGRWEIDDFVITDFAPVKSENLRTSVNRLRSMDITWPDDPVGEVDRLEERDGTIN
ncbi:hypothetical protein [Oceanicola granulosus]|uniref:hypothetical protein n=1 Tax=Oceanicola granulosus TaxID=252302 RepID=UPI0002F9E11B|nr:hypothetical protein [Oceanicola granulosus]